MMKVVLLDKMESKVYFFSDGIYEQFLAHIMKSVFLIDQQLCHFDKLKKQTLSQVMPSRSMTLKRKR